MTGDARIEAVGRSEARQWGLSRVTDSVGNYLTVSYREAEGYAYPQRIDYSGYKTSNAARWRRRGESDRHAMRPISGVDRPIRTFDHGAGRFALPYGHEPLRPRRASDEDHR